MIYCSTRKPAVNKNKSRFLILCAALVMALPLTACGNRPEDSAYFDSISGDDTVIVFTNDIHGYVLNSDTCIGLDGLKYFMDEVQKKTGNVILVDSGDSYQGNYMCLKSKGSYVTDLLSELGYDVVALGNHEFDFGLSRVCELASYSSFSTVCCNLQYTGQDENIKDELSSILPYRIIDGIAFIGVDTPSVADSIQVETVNEDGECSFQMGQNSPNELYETVQANIDECKALGASTIVILSHLGDYAKTLSDYSSDKLIENTSGIDILLDAHTHTIINGAEIRDRSGRMVPVYSTGARLTHIGAINLHKDNSFDVYLLDRADGKDEAITAKIIDLKTAIDPDSGAVMTKSNLYIPYYGEGNMKNSSREDPLGNLLADAYRYAGKADIGILNATSYRSEIPKGDITREMLYDLLPFSDALIVLEVKGLDIMNMLEASCRKTAAVYEDEAGIPIGSNADFLQVSGLKYDIDTSIESGFITSKANTFDNFNSARRAGNIYVEIGGEYEPLDENKTYTLATSSYLAGGGCGMTMLKDCPRTGTGLSEADAFIMYVNSLNGDLAKDYSDVQGRIGIITEKRN